jgi:hypothetical protein
MEKSDSADVSVQITRDYAKANISLEELSFLHAVHTISL